MMQLLSLALSPAASAGVGEDPFIYQRGDVSSSACPP